MPVILARGRLTLLMRAIYRNAFSNVHFVPIDTDTTGTWRFSRNCRCSRTDGLTATTRWPDVVGELWGSRNRGIGEGHRASGEGPCASLAKTGADLRTWQDDFSAWIEILHRTVTGRCQSVVSSSVLNGSCRVVYSSRCLLQASFEISLYWWCGWNDDRHRWYRFKRFLPRDSWLIRTATTLGLVPTTRSLRLHGFIFLTAAFYRAEWLLGREGLGFGINQRCILLRWEMYQMYQMCSYPQMGYSRYSRNFVTDDPFLKQIWGMMLSPLQHLGRGQYPASTKITHTSFLISLSPFADMRRREKGGDPLLRSSLKRSRPERTYWQWAFLGCRRL